MQKTILFVKDKNPSPKGKPIVAWWGILPKMGKPWVGLCGKYLFKYLSPENHLFVPLFCWGSLLELFFWKNPKNPVTLLEKLVIINTPAFPLRQDATIEEAIGMKPITTYKVWNTSLTVEKRGGAMCSCRIKKPRYVALPTFFEMACRKVCMLVLGIFLLGCSPEPLPAQGAEQIGQWERLYLNNQVVTWRKPPDSFGWDQARGNYAPNQAWRGVHGIHAALLPVSGESGNLNHGWVMLWDRGRPNRQLLMQAQAAEPYYFSALSAFQVEKVAITPGLLWHPEDTVINNWTGAPQYGYIRYLFDTDPWESPSANWPIFNLFCAGHAFLPDGRLFVTGGTGGLYSGSSDIGYVGLRLFSIFRSSNFTRTNINQQQFLWQTYTPSLSTGPPEPRWYPSVVALPDGRMLIVGGTQYGSSDDEGTLTNSYEVYDPCTENVEYQPISAQLPGSFQLRDNYPRLHLVSYWNSVQQAVVARVVCTGPKEFTHWLNAWDPLPPLTTPPNNWQVYEEGQPPSPIVRNLQRGAGASVLLPNPAENPQGIQEQVLNEVLVLGGEQGNSVHHCTEILTFTVASPGLSIRSGASMHRARASFSAVLLPNGQLIAIGGRTRRTWSHRSKEHTVYAAELYTPPAGGSGTGSWQLAAEAFATDVDNDGLVDLGCPNVFTCNDADGDGISDGIRVYHSTALLLSDGRVLAVGSNANDSNGVDVDNYVPTLYLPPYLFKPNGNPRTDIERPRIANVSHTELNYGQNTVITYQLADDSNGIRSVVLMRPGSATHSLNFEQRLVRLHFKEEDPTLEVTAAWDPAIAPPGWYMLFLVDMNGVPSKAHWVRLKGNDCIQLAGAFMMELEGAQDVSPEQSEILVRSPLTVEFRDPLSGAVLETYTLPMTTPDEQGRVRLPLWSDLPTGSYELYVRPYRSWLGRRFLVPWQLGGTFLIPLKNGDVVKDNAVDLVDLAAVLESLGETGGSPSDVNADGVVDELDVELVLINSGTVGDE